MRILRSKLFPYTTLFRSEKEQTHIVKIAIQPIDNKNIFHYLKTTFREIYNKHKQANIFDVLLWNDGKEITEFTNGNIVVDINGNLYTPPVSCGQIGRASCRERVEIAG